MRFNFHEFKMVSEPIDDAINRLQSRGFLEELSSGLSLPLNTFNLFIGLSSLVKTMHFECKALALSFHNGRIATHCSLTGMTFSRL
jgi:hypothetical protein